jgi:hypothetical protein
MIRSILILLAAATLAHAGVKKKLFFRDGKSMVVTLSAFDEKTVTLGVGETERKVPWNKLTPVSAYEARKALTPFDDGEARLALTAFAEKLLLYPQAFEQLEIALALGALDETAFEERSKEIEKNELAYLAVHIDSLLESGDDPGACLDAIKRLKERYPGHKRTAAYEKHVPELVEALKEIAEEIQAAELARHESAAMKDLRKKIEKLQKRKDKSLKKAAELKQEGIDAAAKGVISRVKKRLLHPQGAERYLKDARKQLRAIAKLDPLRLVVPKQELISDDDKIGKQLVECYLIVVKAYMRDRNYKRATEYVRNILYYDPIHEEALEIKAEIDANRITRKVSDITNARPRVTGG